MCARVASISLALAVCSAPLAPASRDLAGEEGALLRELESREEIRHPVQFWVLHDSSDSTSGIRCKPGDAHRRYTAELAEAQRILQESGSRIALADLGMTELTRAHLSFEGAVELARTQKLPGCLDDGWHGQGASPTARTLTLLDAITGERRRDVLHVFYVESAGPGVSAVWCAANDPDGRGANTILISAAHHPLDLAHELGHALLGHGGHVDHMEGFDGAAIEQNLMASGSLGDHLTAGQVFRAHVHRYAAVNRNGHRRGPMLDCDDPQPGSACLSLGFDVQWLTPRAARRAGR